MAVTIIADDLSGACDAGGSISQLQAEINRKIGVKPDVFAKYRSEARG
mgnify:CR=1 FL=1